MFWEGIYEFKKIFKKGFFDFSFVIINFKIENFFNVRYNWIM